MGYITLRERHFLGSYISLLQRKTVSDGERILILSILNKLANPHLSFDKRECEYLVQKLSDRFEDACDCRNESEISLIQSLIVKLQKSVDPLA